MKSLDYAGFVETLRLLATVIPANMSKQYSFLIPDEIEVENELDVQQYITDNYYISNAGLTSNIIQNKVFNITVTPGTWAYNDETTFYENIAQIEITFPDNSKLSKNVKVFYREITEYEVPEGLILVGDYIDTGLTLDGRYTIEATGYSNGLSTGAMVGAFENNNLRTTLRILPVSGKIQCMWYKNAEILKSELDSAGVNILSEFTYIQTATNLKIYQNGELKLDKAISSGDATQTKALDYAGLTTLLSLLATKFNELDAKILTTEQVNALIAQAELDDLTDEQVQQIVEAAIESGVDLSAYAKKTDIQEITALTNAEITTAFNGVFNPTPNP